MANRTYLYDTNESEILSVHENGYYVDGKKPTLPNGIVELTHVEAEKLAPTPTHKVTKLVEVDLTSKEYKVNYVLEEKTEREIFLETWDHPEYEMRVKAPITLVFDGRGLALKAWCELRGLPMVSKGDDIYIYLNTIDEQFQSDVETFNLTVEQLNP